MNFGSTKGAPTAEEPTLKGRNTGKRTERCLLTATSYLCLLFFSETHQLAMSTQILYVTACHHITWSMPITSAAVYLLHLGAYFCVGSATVATFARSRVSKTNESRRH